MARKKSILILPQLKDCGGDLTKQWFVEYSCRNPRTDKMERFRVYEGFSNLHTIKERYALARKIINEIGKELKAGHYPFAKEKIVYDDELLYRNAINRWGQRKEEVITIRTHLSEFLSIKKQEVIPHTYQTYQSKLRIFCEWATKKSLSEKHISCITQQDICEFIQHIASVNNVSRRTVQKYEQILHNFFEYLLHTKKLIEKNPVYDIPRIGEIKDEAPYPIPDHERHVLQIYMQAHDPQLWLVCMLEYYCAIRPHNEIRQLRIGDIDFENMTITIRKDISKNRHTETVDMPKQLYEHMLDLKLNEYPMDWYVFSTEGLPGLTLLGKNNFRNRFDKIRKELGLSPRYKLYSFKHTGGIKLVNAGVSTWELQRHFRHKSIETTEKYIRRNVGIKSNKIQNEFPDI